MSAEPYTPGEVPDDALTLYRHEYVMWFLSTLLGKPHYDDRKISEERKILWRLVYHGPCTEPYNKRDDSRTQHHQSRWTDKAIYNNTTSVSPSGMTTTTPSQSYHPPQSHHQLQVYPPAFPTSQSPTLVLPAGYSRSFDGLALIAAYAVRTAEEDSGERRQVMKQNS